MRKRYISLILSFIYCGLGQIYNRQIMKGIDFILIYTVLIASYFAPEPWMRIAGLSALPFMWCSGLFDAYFCYSEGPVLVWKRLLTLLPGIALSLAVLFMQLFVVSEDFPVLGNPIRSANKPEKAAEISIGTCGLKPNVAQPGTILSIEYDIIASRTMRVGLGCFIQRAGTSMQIGDPFSTKVVSVIPEIRNYQREFLLPPKIVPGKYDVTWVLLSPEFDAKYDSRQLQNALTIAVSPTAESGSGIPQPLSGQSDSPSDQSIAQPQQAGNLSIKSYSLRPITAEPGTALSVEYTISTSRPAKVGLGFSIQKAGTDLWIDDRDNDRVIDVIREVGTYSRTFLLPSTLKPGKYSGAWGLWDSNFTNTYDSRKSDNALIISVPPTAEEKPGIPEFFSIQLASFRDAENAESLCSRMLSEGYPARTEALLSKETRWHVVLVGRFPSKEDVEPIVEELRRNNGFSDMVIRRYSAEKAGILQILTRSDSQSSALLNRIPE